MTEIAVMHNDGDWDKITRKNVKDNVVVPFFRGLNLKSVKEVNFYLMHNSDRKYGTSQRNLNFFIYASPGKFTTEQSVIEIEGGTFALEMIIPSDLTGVEMVLDEKNQVVAYYLPQNEEVYVPYNLTILEQDDFEKFTLHLLNAFKVQVLNEIVNRDSWVKGKDKAVLVERIKARVGDDDEREMRRLRNTLREAQNYITEYTQVIKRKYDEQTNALRAIARLEDAEGNSVLEKLTQGLDLIAGHPQVSNIIVEEKYVVVYIDKVYAHARVNGKTRRYYIGNMHVKMDIQNTDVRFFGDNGRHGLWTTSDPHPHVNGSDGVGCLGNVASTIAELCSQKEIYPLFLICLDYLQNANAEDSAGRKIVKWDEVDEEGNLVKKEVECSCDRCDDEIEDGEESYTVYTGFDEGNVVNAETWCQGCRDDYASYSEEVEEAVSDEIWDEVQGWYEDGEDEE